MLLSLRIRSSLLFVQKAATPFSKKLWFPSHKNNPRYFSFKHLCFNGKQPVTQIAFFSARNDTPLGHSDPRDSPFNGFEDIIVGYILGKKKATEVAHLYVVTVEVWKSIVRKGDQVVDATCGNGYDTLAMLKLVADGSGRGCVYGMDIQKDAVESTSSLLASLNPTEKQLVKLFHMCHSKMEEVVAEKTSVRLVAFNLGYLPGGDKEVITKTGTTLLALEAATRIVIPGGLISLVVYVGHAGGWDEYEAVQAFAATLPAEEWICCKLEMINRPSAPVPIFLFKR